VVACILAHQGSASVSLAGVVPLLAAGAEAAGRQDEDLLGYAVDLAHALVVVHDWDLGLADAQRDRASFSHVAVAGDGALLAGGLARAPGGQAHQAYALL